MTYWLDLLTDARALKAVYGETRPTLQNVEITEFYIRIFGRDLILRLNLAEFPEVPPKKWVAQSADTVEIELRLLSLSSLYINGIASEKFANIELDRQGDQIQARIDGPSTTLRATSDFVGVYSMRAFRTDNQAGTS